MKNLLFFFGILCILASCKKNHVEPITSNNTSTSANLLPSLVYTIRPDVQAKMVYRFSYYPNGLLKRIIQYDSVYHQDQKDSTLYTYNASNQVIEMSEYSWGNLRYKTDITYTNSGNIETVWQHNYANQLFSLKYKYVYATATDVAYVLKYDASNTITDSIVVDDNVVTSYYREPGELVYISNNPLHIFITPNGAYYDAGVRNPNSPDADEWGYVYNDPSLAPAVLNKNINFQYEVAEKFIAMGLSGFPARNYYITPGPRQYYSTNGLGNASGYGITYKFDQDDRLIQSIRHFDYYTRSGSPIPGYQITEIRYE